MGGSGALAILLGLAFFTSLAFTGFVRQAGVTDVPNDRSAHKNPIPTAGGMGVIAAIGMSFIVLPHLLPSLGSFSPVTPFLSLIFATAVLGLIDDVFTLNPGGKMAILLGLCLLVVWVIGPVEYLPAGKAAVKLPYFIGFIGSALWVLTVTNAVNFIDGSNGMMALVMAIACFALMGVALAAGAPMSALMAMTLFGALLGFMPYNFRRSAQVFAGDVGALTVGFAYAGIVLLMVNESETLTVIYAGPLLLLPILTDVLLTLAIRKAQGKVLSMAHSQHLYQRLIRSGRTHIQTALSYGFLTLVMGNIALIGASKNWLANPLVLIVPTIVLVLMYVVFSKKLPA